MGSPRSGRVAARVSGLAALLVAACAGPAAGATGNVAVIREEITPPLASPLCAGLVPSAAVVDEPLWAKGVLLDVDGQRYLLLALDYCEVRNRSHTRLRVRLAEAVGTTPERVVVQSLHQHNAPIIDEEADALSRAGTPPHAIMDPEHWRQTVERLASAAAEARGRLSAFDQVAFGSAPVREVASSRRPFDAAGKLQVRWSAMRDPAIRALPEGLIDPLVRTVSLLRQGRPLVRLHYYATHPQSFYGDGRVTSDFPGLARELVEREEQVPQIYFTGCAGDVTAGKYNDGSPRAREELTARLATGLRQSIAASAREDFQGAEWSTAELRFPAREEAAFAAEQARGRLHAPGLSARERSDAAFVVSWAERCDEPVVISALHLNQGWVVHLPGEPFVSFQLGAQALESHAFVAVAGYGDGGPGYLCTERAFAEGGYEPTASLVGPRSEQVLSAGIQQLFAR